MSKYTQLKDGDSFEIERTDGIIKLGCCECGLVHCFDIGINKNGRGIYLSITRDNRATGQRRRYNKFDKK